MRLVFSQMLMVQPLCPYIGLQYLIIICGGLVCFCLSLSQVILCFSPVGSTLRVRARKFPAVVNCTSIDWFQEWPEEALVSVSARFLDETEGIVVSLFTIYVYKLF